MIEASLDSVQSLADLFTLRCARGPQDLAYAFVRDTLDLDRQLTRQELDRAARGLACELRRLVEPGARALVIYPPGLEVVVAFWACILAGLVPVPAPAPDPVRRKHILPHLGAIIEDAQVAVVLSTAYIQSLVSADLFSGQAPVAWVVTDQVTTDCDSTVSLNRQLSETAYLQYTSGSTSAPRGVMISHRNVLAQCDGILRSAGVTDQSRSLCWLPYFHDYGLVHGILAPFYAGIPAYIMSPVTFLRRPLRWLEAIERYGITHSGAPNFAYEACVKAADKRGDWHCDLRTWTVASCGAEPIRTETLDRFCQAFSPWGFRREVLMPAYGLAEATLVVTAAPYGRPPLLTGVCPDALEDHRIERKPVEEAGAKVFVGCGLPLPDTQVMIVNPVTHSPCRSEEIGEIWISGPSVAQGYWNRPDLTQETFGVAIGDESEARYLRTGDLGFLSNGQLFVTGRLKDLIILNGRNLYSHDLEQTIDGCHPALRRGGGAAFSVEEQDAERLVLVLELERVQDVDHGEVATAVRLAVAEQHDVPVWAVVLVRSGGIPKTSSGKIQRQACRKAFVTGTLETITSNYAAGEGASAVSATKTTADISSLNGEARTKQEIRSYLIRIFAQQLGVPVARVSPTAPLVNLGLDSLATSLVKNRLEQELGVPLTFSQFFSDSTIDDLADQLAEAVAIRKANGHVQGDAGFGALREASGRRGVPQCAIDDQRPLSPAQERLWFIEQMQPGSALNHISLGMRLKGRLDIEAFTASVVAVARRHDLLRAIFHSDSQRAWYRVAPDIKAPIRRCSVRDTQPSVRNEEISRLLREEALVPFELASTALWRVLLIEQETDDQVVVVTVHRLIADGWALRLFCKELTAFYNDRVRSRADATLPVPAQYAEYVRWQRKWLDEARVQRQLAYWKRRLNGLPNPVELPSDRPRPHARRFQGGAQSRVLSQALTANLASFCRRQGVTRFMAIYAALTAWLHRYAGVSDIVIGSVVANRRVAQWEEVFGYFVNPVALRMDVAETSTVEQLVALAKQVVVGAHDCQDVPFEQVVGSLNLHRETLASPLFNIMIVLEDDPTSGLDLEGLSAELVSFEHIAVELDLTLLIVNRPGGPELVMLYDRDLFDGATVERMLRQLEILLDGMIAAPAAQLAELPLLSEDEQRHLLIDWNETSSDLPFTGTVMEVMTAQMSRCPEATAIICGDSRITYGELDTRVTRAAHAVVKHTGGENCLVGLCVERSIDGLVGLLGILSAGAAYVPLDPEIPGERLRRIGEDAGVTLILTQRHFRSRLSTDGGPVIEIESLESQTEAEADHPVSLPLVGLDRLAYVMYTSGSTGTPKGVEVAHRALRHSLAARLEHYVESVQRCLLTFSLAFDGSLTAIFWTLMQGGTLIVPPRESYRDPHELKSLIHRHQISHVVWIPSLYDLVLRDTRPGDLASLRTVIVAGESVPLTVVRHHYERLPDTPLYNEYGPTEATVWCSVHRVAPEEEGPRIPIGQPIANTRIYVLDSRMHPVPIGVIGEIYVGGAGLARGYRNQPELTEARFVPDPFMPGGRLYKTGDLARRRPDGNIEYVGRTDQQVKVRGHRIELGDVEAAMRALPGVQDAVVVLSDDSARGPILVAYVIVQERPGPSGRSLRDLASGALPSYMVPSGVIVLDEMPLLPSGKINRAGLPHPGLLSETPEMASGRPRDQIEQILVEMWAQVLGQRAVGIHDNFFGLGGHSLLATQAVSRVREVFRVDVPLRTLFESPTIAEVAEQIRLEQRRIQSSTALPPIVPVPRTDSIPVSYSQQRMWFVQQLAPDATAYNLLFVSRQKGPLKKQALRQAIDALSRRHESFRTTFAMTASSLVQRVGVWERPHWAEVDLRALPESRRHAEAARLAREEGRRPFDLQRGPLTRFFVIQLGAEDHLLVLNMHHIVGDQWSFGILGRDFAAYYNAFCHGNPLPDVPLPIQYADYAAWQRRCLTDRVLERQEDYWKDRLAGLLPLSLPTDYPRPPAQTFNGSYCSAEFPDDLIESINRFSAERHATSFMTLLACFQILLSKYSGQTDVAVGFPIANRTQLVLESLIGTFVNTLVLRTDLAGDPTFDEVMRRVRETALGAYANQDYPFDKLVDTLQIEREPSMPPLVQVMFNMANAPIGDINLHGLRWEPFEVDPGSAQFDLSVTIELEVSKKAYLTFNTDLFSHETAVRMLDHFMALISSAIGNPVARISTLTMMSAGERRQVIEEWNRTEALYPHTRCLPELFEAQVERTPGNIAVSMEGERFTYHELNARANQLARRLRALGVGRDAVVGICLERSFNMVVALLAVLKCGGCYLPLDPDFPLERVRFMAEDAEAKMVISSASLSNRFDRQAIPVLLLDDEQWSIEQESDHNLPPVATAEDVAYLLYTSGSTGQPKGVEVRHRSLVNFLWSMMQAPGCSVRDTMLAVTTISFDIAGLELYAPLLSGARVELVGRAVSMEGRRLVERMERVRPTLMQATPATWRLLIESGWGGSPDLTAFCGGEALPQELARELCARTKALWNMYGPTETTIWSTIARIHDPGKQISIGRPINNTEIYILDQHLQPVPAGVPGEIYIGGHGVAKGYRRRPDLTRERFLAHPFRKDEGARLYRTGDMGRYRPDGTIEHLGRCDHQVKIRGFRVELGEIESVLSRHPAIRQAVVAARDDQHGFKQLVAYLVRGDSRAPSVTELRNFVRATLPDYMTPSHVVFLEALPLTANNKVDVRALPAPADDGLAGGKGMIAPCNSIEVQVAALWQQVLGVHEVGVHENFFDLGGHSLKAAQLFFLLEAIYGKQLPLATLFQAPTIAELAEVLSQEHWVPPWRSLVAIQPNGSGIPLFVIPGVGGNVLMFSQLARLLGPEQPVYGLQARGLDGKELPFTSIPEMARHYVGEIRTIRPSGPYLIAGACTGGVIAYEMAQQLDAIGEHAVLTMMDSWHPMSYKRHRYKPLLPVWLPVFVLVKLWGFGLRLLRTPCSEWLPLFKEKQKTLGALLRGIQTEDRREQPYQLERITQATMRAVARYDVHEYAGGLLNIVAANRPVGDSVLDSRKEWERFARGGTETAFIPAEDSGLLLRAPHVHDTVEHLRRYLGSRGMSLRAHARHRESKTATSPATTGGKAAQA